MVVGEFGGNLDWPLGQASLRDRDRWSHITPGVDAQWQNAFVDYMVEKQIEGCLLVDQSGIRRYRRLVWPCLRPGSNTAGWGQWLPFDPAKTNFAEQTLG